MIRLSRRYAVALPCACTLPALAQWYWPPDFSAGASCSPVTLTIAGEWPDSCVPRGSITAQVEPGRIDVTIEHGYPPDVGCLAVISSWSRTASVQQIAAGAYDVYFTLTSQSRPPLGPTLAGRTTIACPNSCIADLDDGSGNGTSDGAVTIEDLVFMARMFEAGDQRGDIADELGNPGHDGAVGIDDLVLFLQRFDAGC